MNEPITVKCWTCGMERRTQKEGPTLLGVSVALAAISVNWCVFADLVHCRTLVFCTDRCVRDARDENGHFYAKQPNT